MKLKLVYIKALSGSLTCSETMDVLMDQPTKPVDRKVESHAHLHTMEGFQLSKDRFSGNKYSFQRKQLHWENPTHLYPEGATNFGVQGQVSMEDYGRQFGKDYGNYGGVYQDPDRLPPNRSFADRTGLPALARVVTSTTTTYTVWKYPDGKMGKPNPVKLTGVSESEIQNLKP